MVSNEDTLWCDGCGVEILWPPVIYNHQFFCCEKCCRGEECDCGDQQDSDEERRSTPAAPLI